MSEHTPLPWTYRAASDVEDGIIIGGANSNAAIVPGYNNHPHNVANAALICKAVNNHEAMVACLEWLNHRGGLGSYAHERIRDILSRVGQQPETDRS